MGNDLPKTDTEAAFGLWVMYNSKLAITDYRFCRTKGCSIGESLRIIHSVQIKRMQDSGSA